MNINPHLLNKRIDFKEVKNLIKPYTMYILRKFVPSGRMQGHEYVALNPTRPDSSLGSFKVNTNTGKWSDFATGDKGGDLIALVAYVRGLSQIEAARELLKMIGRTR